MGYQGCVTTGNAEVEAFCQRVHDNIQLCGRRVGGYGAMACFSA